MPDDHRDDGYRENRWDAQYIIARDGPRALEEGVHRRTLASLNNGWLARGGHLYLHDDRLEFAPTPLERLLFARRLRVEFSEIGGIERHPPNPADILPGGKAPRMRVLTERRPYDFLFVHGLDDWIEALAERMRIWESRRRFAPNPEPLLTDDHET